MSSHAWITSIKYWNKTWFLHVIQLKSAPLVHHPFCGNKDHLHGGAYLTYGSLQRCRLSHLANECFWARGGATPLAMDTLSTPTLRLVNFYFEAGWHVLSAEYGQSLVRVAQAWGLWTFDITNISAKRNNPKPLCCTWTAYDWLHHFLICFTWIHQVGATDDAWRRSSSTASTRTSGHHRERLGRSILFFISFPSFPLDFICCGSSILIMFIVCSRLFGMNQVCRLPWSLNKPPRLITWLYCIGPTSSHLQFHLSTSAYWRIVLVCSSLISHHTINDYHVSTWHEFCWLSVHVQHDVWRKYPGFRLRLL